MICLLLSLKNVVMIWLDFLIILISLFLLLIFSLICVKMFNFIFRNRPKQARSQ